MARRGGAQLDAAWAFFRECVLSKQIKMWCVLEKFGSACTRLHLRFLDIACMYRLRA